MIAVLFFLGLAHSTDVETLFLQKKRVEAAQLILKQLQVVEDEQTRGPLLSQLNRVMQSHYTNQSMRLYEESLSLFREKPQEALAKLNQVEKLEPQNSKVIGLKAVTFLSIDKCRDAEKEIEKIAVNYPIATELRWQRVLLAACRKAKLDDVDGSDLTESLLMARAAHASRLNRIDLLRLYLVELEVRYSDYPEIWFYKQLLAEDNLAVEKSKGKYRTRCQTYGNSKKYLANPWLCKGTHSKTGGGSGGL